MSGDKGRRHYVKEENEMNHLNDPMKRDHSVSQHKESHPSSNSIVLIKFQAKLDLCSGVLIHDNLVLTSYHCLEGFSIKSCQVSIDNTQVSVLGYVEIDAFLDYCILKIKGSFHEFMVKMNVDAIQSSQLVLDSRSSGLCSENKQLVSSGGGYFNPPGEFCGLHQVLGYLGMEPEITVLPLHTIIYKNSHSILSNIAQHQDTEKAFPLLETDILPIHLNSCPLDLHMTTTTIEIPCSDTGTIREFTQSFPLQPDQEKLFYWLLNSLKYYDFCVPFHHPETNTQQKAQLIKSLSESQLSTDATLATGVRLEFLGDSYDQMYYIYQIKTNNHRQSEHESHGSVIIGEIELGLELISAGTPLKDHPLSGVMLSRNEYQKELVKRIRFGFLKSYETRQIQRISLN
jgi:hypothetical protein